MTLNEKLQTMSEIEKRELIKELIKKKLQELEELYAISRELIRVR